MGGFLGAHAVNGQLDAWSHQLDVPMKGWWRREGKEGRLKEGGKEARRRKGGG
jgi:hypothetical protein